MQIILIYFLFPLVLFNDVQHIQISFLSRTVKQPKNRSVDDLLKNVAPGEYNYYTYFKTAYLYNTIFPKENNFCFGCC